MGVSDNMARPDFRREIDLLQCLHKHSTRISCYPQALMAVGFVFLAAASIIAQVQTYNPLYAIFAIAPLCLTVFGLLSGVGIGGDTFPDENSIPFNTSLANHYNRLKNKEDGDDDLDEAGELEASGTNSCEIGC